MSFLPMISGYGWLRGIRMLSELRAESEADFTFIVKDVDAVASELKRRGAKIEMEPVDFGNVARIMMVADPDGNRVEFAAPKSR